VADYRLAPEAAYPAQLDDALAAFAWARENGPSGASSATSMFVAGDSAGGGLTLALLITLRDRGLDLPNAAVTLSAWTDMTMSGATLRTRASRDPILADATAMTGAVQGYLQGADPRTPAASPVHAHLQGLPPLFMVVGDEEVLLDDTLRVAANASGAGVDVNLHVEAGAFHVYPWFVPQAPESIRAIEAAGAFLKAHG
jgi:acetyl esterase/lipase